MQDYWLLRSFLINKTSVSRLIFGVRYTNNYVLERPFSLPYSYHELQKYKMFLGSATLSFQKYYKTNLIYNFGHTEDIPSGGLIRMTAGKEINEFNSRIYLGGDASLGKSSKELGYIYISAGLGSFLEGSKGQQGILKLEMNYFSNLFILRDYMIRNFVNINFMRGFGRFTDEHITFSHLNGFSGFRNDSVQRNPKD